MQSTVPFEARHTRVLIVSTPAARCGRRRVDSREQGIAPAPPPRTALCCFVCWSRSVCSGLVKSVSKTRAVAARVRACRSSSCWNVSHSVRIELSGAECTPRRAAHRAV